MNLETNPQLDLAYQYICNTNKHLFLTGKAGSGKTTFLHKLRAARVKRMAIVAPTGVAAINAGGMTIHSLFQIAIGMHLPGVNRQQPHGRFRGEKIRMIRSLDLLVIDEVSMVRADLLDAIDEVLRRIRQSEKPFGGVQLLMIGDLHQLPPVVKPDEWNLLRKHYPTPYFFGSQALSKTDYVAIELKHIYRQADPEFIALLNQVRDNCLDDSALRKLNSRYKPDFQPTPEVPYITLTATNAAATEINSQSLMRLPGKKRTFTAQVTGDFPNSSFPTEENLELKVGAQVMFIRNDTSDARLFFNGKLGSVTRITDDNISIRCPNENQDIVLEPVTWENIKYTLNEQTKSIEEQIVGSFTQYPLRHAWAITIHKSQGLTFERCIIDAQAAFASGQVYVALSRCKSFEGIVLRSPIFSSSVKTDPVVQEFSAESDRNAPTEAQLRSAKREYQAMTLHSLFQFNEINEIFRKWDQLRQSPAPTLALDTEMTINVLRQNLFVDLQEVNAKFAPQLAAYLHSDDLPEENEALQTRLRKASKYFVDKLTQFITETKQISIESGSEELREQIYGMLAGLRKLLASKKLCFAACSEGFTAERVQQAKVDAELEAEETAKPRDDVNRIPKDCPHPQLYELLIAWRRSISTEKDLMELDIVPNLSLKEIASLLPTTKGELNNIRGIGKARSKKYGEDLIRIVSAYCQENQIASKASCASPSHASNVSAPTPSKSQTKNITLQMFRDGQTVAEIAKARSLSVSTIEGHLGHFVEMGELDIKLLLDEESLGEIAHYLNSNPNSILSQSKEHFGDKYSYGQLRLAYSAWQKLAE